MIGQVTAVWSLLAATCIGLAVALIGPTLGSLGRSAAHSETSISTPGGFLIARLVKSLRGLGPMGRRARSLERERVIRCLQALAGELRAGQAPVVALQHAAGTPPVWPITYAGLSLGADAAQTLYQDAERNPVLTPLAACWQVCAATGSGLAVAIERLAESARVAEEVHVELEAQLAGPRATARMLAGLPVIAVLLGMALGGAPLQWLLGSPIGWTCAGLGGALTLVGWLWTGQIARRVEQAL